MASAQKVAGTDGRAVVTLLFGGGLLLMGGCSVAFDAPAPSANQEVRAQVRRDLADIAAEEASGKVKSVKDRAVTMVQEGGGQGGEAPSLSFEKFAATMPQLLMRGTDNAIVWVDGDKLEPNSIAGQDRIVLIAPGHHELKVKYPNRPLFTANFYIEKGERVIMHGNFALSNKRN